MTDAGFAVVPVAHDAPSAILPHRCADGADRPIEHPLGARTRALLAEGESAPVTARCRHCDRRVFVSLVDPGSQAVRRAAARPDPSALRPPTRRGGHLRLVPPARRAAPELTRPAVAECPACGQVPDAWGRCRCSL